MEHPEFMEEIFHGKLKNRVESGAGASNLLLRVVDLMHLA
jgi:hypothetical protein